MKKLSRKSKALVLMLAVTLGAMLGLSGCTIDVTSGDNHYSINTEEAKEKAKAALEHYKKQLDDGTESANPAGHAKNVESSKVLDPKDIPDYDGEPFVTVNNNEPHFTKEEMTTESYEHYSDLDKLGRCGETIANVGQDLMPTEKRGSIGSVKPTGWHTVKYDFVQGKYLYNRCHLIGYQLSGENANNKNLITGTRYLNVDGMLPFENMVADYVKETANHVLYRVTPIFDGNDLVAKGVQMEAKSVEDNGKAICYNVFVYNVQPGVVIDYATGKSVEG